jgi:hypothetical protein
LSCRRGHLGSRHGSRSQQRVLLETLAFRPAVLG